MKLKTLNFIGAYFDEVTNSKEILKLPESGIEKLDFELIQLIMESVGLHKQSLITDDSESDNSQSDDSDD